MEDKLKVSQIQLPQGCFHAYSGPSENFCPQRWSPRQGPDSAEPATASGRGDASPFSQLRSRVPGSPQQSIHKLCLVGICPLPQRMAYIPQNTIAVCLMLPCRAKSIQRPCGTWLQPFCTPNPKVWSIRESMAKLMPMPRAGFGVQWNIRLGLGFRIAPRVYVDFGLDTTWPWPCLRGSGLLFACSFGWLRLV